jgi:hypothetical protein
MGLHYHASVDSDWLNYLDCDIIHSITSDLEYNQKERYILCVVQTVAEIISERWAGILTGLTTFINAIYVISPGLRMPPTRMPGT